VGWTDLGHDRPTAGCSTLCETKNGSGACLIKDDWAAWRGHARVYRPPGEPDDAGSDRRVLRGWGLTVRGRHTERDRDVGPARQHAEPAALRSDRWAPAAGLPIVLVDPVTNRAGDEGEICYRPGAREPHRADDGISGLRGSARRGHARLRIPHGRRSASRGRRGYITLSRPHRRRVQGVDYRISPVRAGRASLLDTDRRRRAAVVPVPEIRWTRGTGRPCTSGRGPETECKHRQRPSWRSHAKGWRRSKRVRRSIAGSGRRPSPARSPVPS